jgi:hypothetical protein
VEEESDGTRLILIYLLSVGVDGSTLTTREREHQDLGSNSYLSSMLRLKKIP